MCKAQFTFYFIQSLHKDLIWFYVCWILTTKFSDLWEDSRLQIDRESRVLVESWNDFL